MTFLSPGNHVISLCPHSCSIAQSFQCSIHSGCLKRAITLLYFSWTTRLFFYEQDGQLLVCVRGCVESYALSINFSKCSNLFCEFVVNTQRRQQKLEISRNHTFFKMNTIVPPLPPLNVNSVVRISYLDFPLLRKQRTASTTHMGYPHRENFSIPLVACFEGKFYFLRSFIPQRPVLRTGKLTLSFFSFFSFFFS